MRGFILLFLSLLATTGCTGERFQVLVDLRTDYAPGTEFDRVVVRLFAVDAAGVRATDPLRTTETSARTGQDLLAGERVAELGALEEGTYAVELDLFRGTMPVGGRTIVVSVDADVGLVVVITRACGAIDCPTPDAPASATSCIAGICVDPRCVSGGDPECPSGTCAADTDCPPPAAACAAAACAEGFCLYGARPSACDAAEYCDPDVGCLPIGSIVDGGMDGAIDGAFDSAMDAGADTPPDATGPWLVPWSRRRPIDFLAARVAEDLSDFPAYVGISADGSLAANASPSGADIVFTDADGMTPLDFEIERFDSSTGRLDAWVRLPLLSSTADTRIYLYYGNPAAPTPGASSEVWNAQYVGVWHLAQEPGVSPAIVDSTGGVDLTPAGAMTATARQTGQLGWAIDFDGVDDRLSSAVEPRLAVTNLTITAWVQARTFPGNTGTIVARSTMEGASNHDYFLRAGDGDLNFGVFTGASDGITWGGWSTTGEWHSLAATYDGTLRIYFDGSEVATDPGEGLIRDSMRPFHIGSWGVPDATRTWNGLIDEVRISSVARSASWIATRHANERDAASFLVVGGEDVRP